MGMTIEDKVRCLQSLKCPWEVELRRLSNPVEIGIHEDIINSLDTAIETMRKYQQIVDIVSLNGEEFKQCGLKELKEILEVIADGTINSSSCI